MAEAGNEANPFDDLPNESLVLILELCAPRDLARCEMFCRRWRDRASSTCCSSAWLRHARDGWVGSGWTHNVPPLPPRPTLERLGEVPVGAMRRALVRFDTAGLVERGEWTRLLRAKLVWGTSVCSRRSPTRGWSFPDWAASANDCKAAFLLARVEARRGMPLESELPRQKWDLVYNQHPSETFEIEFLLEGHEMTASSHPGMKFTWCLLPTGLQIETFPMHKFVRKANGLWIMSNAHVTIEQRVPPPGDLPLDLSPS